MKKLLAFEIMLLCAVQGWAANPSFQSFDTNDFIAVAPTVKLRHSVDTGTNIFNNFIIINTNTVIVNTETHVTNVFTSIFNSFVTNVTDNSVTIITNSINNVTFTTNFIDNSTIVISNTFVIFTNTSVTIDGTNVPTINPTIGRIPYKSGTNSFDDSALYFIDPTTVGANEVDVNTVGVTNLVTGGFVISVDSGSGYGILTNAPFSDFALWTNIGGILQPTGTPSEIHGKLGGTNYFSLRQVSGTPYMDFVNPVTGTLGSVSEVSGAITLADSSQASLFAGTQLLTVLSTGRAYLSRGLNTSEFDIYGYLNGSDYSKLAISHTGTNGAVVFDSQASGTAGLSKDFWFQNSDKNSEIFIKGTNGSIYSFIGLNAGGQGVLGTSAGILALAQSGNIIYFDSDGLFPVVTNLSLGITKGTYSAAEPWKNVVAKTNTIVGFQGVISTNYSWLSISHTGTNAWDRILFDSLSGGIAGTVGRPFAFTNAPIILPRYTKAQKATLTPDDGMVLFQTDNTPGIRVYQSGAWVMVSTVADP